MTALDRTGYKYEMHSYRAGLPASAELLVSSSLALSHYG